jgi:chromosome partitioning protein
MHTFNFCSFKGGTTKTSTAMHIGACLAKYHNKKVLLIDFDSQANLSIGLGIGSDSLKTMAPVLQGQEHIKSVIQETSISGLYLIASNTYLDGIECTHPLVNNRYSHEYLKRSLKDIQNEYDFCFIDTPPSLGWLTQSAFYASQYTIVCVIPQAYSVLALSRLNEFIEAIRVDNPVDVFGVCASCWNDRGAYNNKALQLIQSSFPDKVFSSKIRRDEAISKAAYEGKTILEFDENGRASQDYKNLTEEFLNRFNISLKNNINMVEQYVRI